MSKTLGLSLILVSSAAFAAPPHVGGAGRAAAASHPATAGGYTQPAAPPHMVRDAATHQVASPQVPLMSKCTDQGKDSERQGQNCPDDLARSLKR